MKKELLISQLTAHINDQHYLSVTVGKDNTEIVNCIPISMNNKMLLVLAFYDFLPDGYMLLKLQDIDEINYNEACQYFEKIVKNEGASALIQSVPKIIIESWKSAFISLKDADLIVMVDIGKEDSVNVGKIIKATTQKVSMLCFSPTGIWDDDEWDEPYKNITSVRFLDHYTITYAKYL